MRLVSIDIRGYPPFGDLKVDFPEGIIALVGSNGCGKTRLLNLLATFAGNDAATHLCAHEDIKDVELVVETDMGQNEVLRISDRIDPEIVSEFKERIGNRINYGITENYSSRYIHGCCEKDTFENLLHEYSKRFVSLRPRSNSLGMSLSNGDGAKQIIRICSLISHKNQPLMMDMPDRHIDLVAKRWIMSKLSDARQQIIYVTHCPEMIASLDSIKSLT